MFRTISRITDRVLPIGVADAHCDIPCGIYDPRDAIQAAQTVIRMTELIEEMGAPSSVAEHNSFARYVAAKEEHATKAKDDIQRGGQSTVLPELNDVARQFLSKIQ